MAIQTSLSSDEFRNTIKESRQRFLNILCNQNLEAEEERKRQNETNKKKYASRKISFKVRKTSTTYKKNFSPNIQKTTIKPSTVADLATKFNEIINKQNEPYEHIQLKKLVKRLNSFNTNNNSVTMKQTNLNGTTDNIIKEQRKPSIKKKPVLEDKVKVQVKKRNPSNSSSKPLKTEELLRQNENLVDKSNLKTFTMDKPAGFVKAAIQNFEKKNFPLIIKRKTISAFDESDVRDELDSNRRKSCKPDISMPNNILDNDNVEADIENIAENHNLENVIEKPLTKNIKLNSRSEPNLAVKRESEKLIYDFSPPTVKSSESELRLMKVAEPNTPIGRLETINKSFEKNYNEFEKVNEKHDEPCTEAEEPLCPVTEISTKAEEYESMGQTETEINQQELKPNTSFLWKRCSPSVYQEIQMNFPTIGPHKSSESPSKFSLSRTLPKDFKEICLQEMDEVYEELNSEDGYEPLEINSDYEEVGSRTVKEEGLYEYLNNEVEENIYETLSSARRGSKQDVPLPERPNSKNSVSYSMTKNEELASNCYESIYNHDSIATAQTDNNYECIYFSDTGEKNVNSDKDIAGSIVSSEQKTNSLYGTSLRSWNEGTIYNGSAPSDISFSDKSEWIDVSENEEDGNSKFIIIKEAIKNKKSGSWSQQCRQQWMKTEKSIDEGADNDSDHHYETLRTSEDEGQECCYDSFSSDSDSDDSFENYEENNENNLPLPAAPNSNDVLTRLAASATKHVRRFTKNLSMTRNDISKSLTRIARRKSKNDVNEVADNVYDSTNISTPVAIPTSEVNSQNKTDVDENNEKNKSLSRIGFLNKIRRSIIMSPEQANEITSHLSKGRSTFYLTPTINVDDPDDTVERKAEDDSGISLSPIDRSSRKKLIKPQSPPPPVPISALNEDLRRKFKEKRSQSMFAEGNLTRTSEEKTKLKEKRPTTCWYDEIGLYQKTGSTPSTSSAENSGTNTNTTIKLISPINFKQEKENSEKYYDIGNQNNYYNTSVHSLNSTKTDLSLTSLPGDDIQSRLQNEPLYQFYDAAISDYVCHDGISDLDSDNYEDVERRSNSDSRSTPRPSAMELIVPKRNSFGFTKTLWCEIPEVLQSSVLSTLSSHQKKLQEAKFEMITSEASYLNSLNVLNDHFIKNLAEILSDSEVELLFGKIEAVTQSSSKLLLDLEKCWQDNILLHGVCDVIQKHAEEDFSVYIPYCENHMSLEEMMKKLRDRPLFAETLKQLEASPVCECLSLYSFLMLPMQRITRWPLLLDAVLKRLDQYDPEYITCQYVLATINKIVSQCNEAARNKERELEMSRIESKMEFGKGVAPLELAIPNRWLIRSGSVTHIQPKAEEIKLTFGKKISKATLNLFLFNDLFVVTKPKSDGMYSVIHYCSRNFTELSTSDQLLSIPGKDLTGKNLFFLTILENQNKKTVEMLLSCSSESDRQRWIEALTPPKSEDPDEVLYECWDCPQLTVVHNYTAVQPDELNLLKGDIINVSRKMADGWYQGERIRDGQTGWFPANYTVEIANPHVRARNLKQRYRLLTYSENYLKNK